MWRLLFSVFLCVSLTAAFQKYQENIPNGDRVPNPCGEGTWPGVGHLLITGSGPRNPFGMDFAAAGHQWTIDLCEMDSDNDGLTNGQELGDAGCGFTMDDPGELTMPLAHPGICEPVGGVACSTQTFTCPS